MSDTVVRRLCARILALLLLHRRASPFEQRSTPEHHPRQLEQLATFVTAGEPILMTLPGFPCKSPNPAKVLGSLPDEGERLSLGFLYDLCLAIEAVYPPGARLVICSDGHAFADVIGVTDAAVSSYAEELSAMITRENLVGHTLFGLRDVYEKRSYDDMRAALDSDHAPHLDELRREVSADAAARRLYQGITRFLFEDTADWAGSRSSLQRRCRHRAYRVIARSRAWAAVIAERFPRSLRLSIHPQTADAAKLGISLLSAADRWTTPWHSVALYGPNRAPVLVRRDVADRIGTVVTAHGRPDHYVTPLDTGPLIGRPIDDRALPRSTS